MTGSPRPVWFTLRSMICLRELICSAVGWMRSPAASVSAAS